ncbi:FKBP-type peptidyl-prolyl cis-trans isomerase [Deltaproteobacteria bacterium TL4]
MPMKVGSNTVNPKAGEAKVNKKPQLAIEAAFKKKRSGLEVYIEKYGRGEKLEKGSKVKVHYEGWLAKDYKLFDSSRQKKRPFEFVLGEDQVIKGWDEALEGIPVGTKMQIKIPAALAYGAQSTGEIPPNSDLIFKIEVLRASGTTK